MPFAMFFSFLVNFHASMKKLSENDSDLQGTSSIFGHTSESSSATQSLGAIVGDNLGVQQPNVWAPVVLSSVSCGLAESVL